MIIRGDRHRIITLNDCRQTEIRDPRMAVVINKDIWLNTCQSGGNTGFRGITYSLEVPVDDVTGVEKVKTLSNIR